MSGPALDLLRRTTCPHCWTPFAPEDVLWVSAHADLRGDPRLGSDQQQRFLPTRFTPDGAAVDAKGFPCTGLACPHCHLPLARPLLEMEPFFISILGTPSCGKSFYLAALTWELRRLLPQDFGLGFTDADPTANLVLTEYEKALFLNPEPDRLVPLAHLIRKTELQGELYDTVSYGGQVINYPRPFQFVVRPLGNHPNHASGNRAARVLCLYDNAGEHCLPGQDSTATPAIQHLSRSRALLFLFDPTQDPRFRSRYRPAGGDGAAVTNRQELVLLEAATRVRRYLGMRQTAKHDRPLIVVLTKADVWQDRLFMASDTSEPWRRITSVSGLDMDRIESWSWAARQLLMQTCPEIVNAAEDFATRVLYMPVSALGQSPEIDPATGRPSVRPREIRPKWVLTPLLVALREGLQGLISRLKSPAPVARPANTDGLSAARNIPRGRRA